MSKRFSKLLQWGIIGIWLCLVATLVYRQYFSGAEFTPLQSLSAKQFKKSEEWLGIYTKNSRTGYVMTTAEKIGDEYRFTQLSEISVMQDDKAVKNVTEIKCLTDLNYRVKSYEFENRSGDVVLKARGEIDEDNMLLVFFDTKGKKETRARQLRERPYMAFTLKHLVYARGLEAGKRFKAPVLNIFTLNIEEIIIEVIKLIPVKIGINVQTAYLLQSGQDLIWMSDGGRTLKEEYPSGLLYVAESEEMAKSEGDFRMFDFLSLPVLKSNKRLANPDALLKMKVRIEGVDLAGYPLLNGGRQVLKDGLVEITGETVEMMKEKTYALPYDKKGLENYLSPTSYVQSDHHTIKFNADKFVAIEKDAFRFARYLTSNLYLTINKMPQSRLLTAMEIFNARSGESNEHTVMFTSFARAGGMPTRMVGGLVYLKGYFYYHTWPEVWLDGWMPVDPAMGQFPADVTHIRLIDGDIDSLAEESKIMKKIKIEIVEAL